MSKESVRVRFEWFEPWFNKQENFFNTQLLDAGYKVEVIVDKNTEVDIEFISVYPPLRRDIQARIQRLKKRIPIWQRDTTETYPLEYFPDTQNAKARVWYTSENIRPPYQNDLNLTLSFDQDPLSGLNFYLPQWQLHLDHQKTYGRPLNPNSALGRQIEMQNLLKKRTLDLDKFDTKKFACAFVANPQPTRLRMIDELSKYGQVDVFGLHSGRSVTSKYEVAREYKFFICPENDHFPGYVTEKLLDAYMCETIPIYWGDLGLDLHINRSAHINLSNFKSISDLAMTVAGLNRDSYKEIYERPFLSKEVELNKIQEALVALLV